MKNLISHQSLVRFFSIALVVIGSLTGTRAYAAATPTPVITTAISNVTLAEDAAAVNSGFSYDCVNTCTVSITPTDTSFASLNLSHTSASKSGTLTITPKENQFGSAQVTLRVVNSTNSALFAVNTFTIQVNSVNDLPTLPTFSTVTIDEDTATDWIPIGAQDVEDEDSTLTTTVTGNNSTVLPASGISVQSGSFRLTPAANQFTTSPITITVTTTDSDNGSVSRTFSFNVTSVDDPPTFTIGAVADVADSVASYNYLSNATVIDIDTSSVTATVTNGFSQKGEFYSSSLLAETRTGSPATVQSWLRNRTFTPSVGTLPPGTSAQASVAVQLESGTNTIAHVVSFTVTSANGAPTMSPEIVSILDTQPKTPFTLNAQDDDESNSYGIEVSIQGLTSAIGTLGALSTTNGTLYEINEAVSELVFTPTANAVHQSTNLTVTFTVREYAAGAVVNTVSSQGSLVINEHSDAPVLTRFDEGTLYTDDDTIIENVFREAMINDVDWGGQEPLDIQLTVNSTYGDVTYASSITTGTMNTTSATSWLQALAFKPKFNSVPIGESRTVIISVTVTDAVGLTASAQQTVVVSGKNSTPHFEGVPPSGVVELVTSNTPPFNGIFVSDDSLSTDDLSLTITIDDPAKGTLVNSGNISGVTASGNSLTYTGNLVAISNLLQTLTFEENFDYSFPVGAPRITQFTLSATDSFLETGTVVISVQPKNSLANYLVTNTQSSGDGSLSNAVAKAKGGDFITFALEDYPAVIRLEKTMVLNRACALVGPGADLLTLSGDFDADGFGDVQLFDVQAEVIMEGLTLAKGNSPDFGGAVKVQPNGSLTLRDCSVVDSVAKRWGGAVSVELGELYVERCLFKNNSTDASTGLGGGAILIYSEKNVTIDNTTFSQNKQTATTGIGGGAIYMENSNPANTLQLKLTHCTFAENTDAVDKASAILVNAPGTELRPKNSLFADSSGRNIQISGGGDVISQGGNLSVDSTYTLEPRQSSSVYLLDQSSDKRSVADTNLKLGALTQLEGPTEVYPLALNSAAMNNGLISSVGIDQRGFWRNEGLPDTGAYEYDAHHKVVINEILAKDGASDFVELYVPRNAFASDLTNCTLWLDGAMIQSLAAGLMIPGSGTVVNVSLPSEGLLEIKNGSVVLEAVNYVDSFPELTAMDLSVTSITLAPQFKGAAFLPHSKVKAPPFGAWDPNKVGGNTSSPGSDTGNTPFGADNATPFASPDHFIIGEDDLSRLDVLANDSDADGSDLIYITALSQTNQDDVVSIDLLSGEVYGDAVIYDPRSIGRFQGLAAGEEATSSFQYTIKDYEENGTEKGATFSADVMLSIIGANDLPVATNDMFYGTEEQILKLMADTQILVNDSDIDSDDDAGTLKVVGVLNEVFPIESFAGTVGDLTVLVESAAHGLSSGDQLVISGYGGHPSYNGVHVVSVVDANQFTIPVVYVDTNLTTGVWGRFEDGLRLQAVSRLNASVTLDIRANRSETFVSYNPTGSAELNALALGTNDLDRFYYALEDSHGGISLGAIEVMITGVNETPVNQPDPATLSKLLPYVSASNSLENVISTLTVIDYVETPDGRADVRVTPVGVTAENSIVLTNLWQTTEDLDLVIDAADILVNDSDEDTTDILSVSNAFQSVLGVSVLLAQDHKSLTYEASDSSVLRSLSQGENVMDSFKVVVTDSNGGYVTNVVGLLVRGVNDTPIAVDDLVTTDEDISFVLNPMTNSLSYDIEYDQNGTTPDDVLWVVPANGITTNGAAFSISNNLISYNPATSTFFDGLSAVTSTLDVVQYTVTDQSFIFANDDLFRVAANGSDFDLDVLANDRNYNIRSSAMTIVAVGIPDHAGVITTNSTATRLIYTPSVSFVGDEVLTYTIEDLWGNRSQARITLRVTSELDNGHIQANADQFTVAYGESVSLPVLANDNTLPASGTALSITALSGTNGNATVSIQGGSLSFTSQTLGSTTFRYTVSGGGTALSTADVTVNVIDRRTTLLTHEDHYSVKLNSTDNPLDVVMNDTIMPGGTPYLLDSSMPIVAMHGTAVVDATANVILYTPDADYVGMEQFSYYVIDQEGGTGSNLVTIAIGNPVVALDRYVVASSSTTNLYVLDNDRELPNQPKSLVITAVDSSSLGTLSIAGNGAYLRFVANASTGTETVAYTVTVGDGANAHELSGSLELSVEESGLFAVADNYFVATGGAAVTLPVLNNDRSLPEQGRSLVITSMGTGPDAPNQGGQLQIAAGGQALLYTPAVGFVGEETFTYSVTDTVGTDFARVTVQVHAPALTANDDAFSVYHQGTNTLAFTLPVILNDTLLSQSPGQLVIVGIGIGADAPSQQGTVTIAPDGQSLSYRPNTNYTGTTDYLETFTYELGDGVSANRMFGQVAVNVLLRDEATEVVQLTNDDRFSVAGGSISNMLSVLNNDGALPGSATSWTITSLTTPTFGGSVSIEAGQVSYTPLAGFVGTDSFEYTISDGFGGSASAEVMVKVGDIMLVSDSFAVISGTSSNAIDVLVNDGIQQGLQHALTVDAAFNASEGAVLTVSSNLVYYTPMSTTTNYPYVETFEYTVLDDSLIAVTQQVSVLVIEQNSDRSSANIIVTVNGVNDLPVTNGFVNALSTDDKTPIKPYPSVSVTDVDEWGNERQTVTITLDNPLLGSLTNLGSFVEAPVGMYTMTGTPLVVSASLTNLVYVPVENRIDGGTNEVVRFDLTLRDPYMTNAFTSALDLTIWSVNDAPVISGIQSDIPTTFNAPVLAFPTAVVTDVDEFGAQLLSAIVTVGSGEDDVERKLTNLGAFVKTATGVYEMSGTPAQVTTALHGLTYTLITSSAVQLHLSVRDDFVEQPVTANVTVRFSTQPATRDDWNEAYFTQNPDDAGDLLDPDGDGLSNIEEYAFGTDPTQVNDSSAHEVQMVDQGSGTVTISFSHRSNDPSLTFVLQTGLLMDSWTDASELEISRSSQVVSSTIIRETIELVATGNVGFYRVVVQ